MKEKNVESYLLTSLDDIAWLFNIRGNDVLFNPVALSYSIITDTEAKLFIDKSKVNKEVEDELKLQGIEVFEYLEIEEEIKKLNGKVLIDPVKVLSLIHI